MNTPTDANPPTDPPPATPTGGAAAAAPAGQPTTPRKPRARPADPGTDETIKETVEALVIAFILAFVFRAFVVEAFIIPTGSMAPTLLGKHIDTQCPSCGYRFDAGLRGGPGSGQPLGNNTEVACPMCRYPVQLLAGTRIQAGDRILVDKFIYTFSDPKRWDVIVFKNPQAFNDDGPPPTPGPRSNFIKRLVGLPGEQVYLLDGDVFVAPPGSDAFTIARKPDPETNPHWERIQRAMWQPIYHSQYVPLVTGVPGRGDGTIDQARDGDHAWDVPWFAVDGSDSAWRLGTALSPRRSYRFEGGTGRIVFGFRSTNARQTRSTLGFPMYPYNRNLTGGYSNGLAGSSEPIEDIRLAVSVMPTGGAFALTLSTTARLDQPANGTETLSATVTDTGEVTVTATDGDGKTRRLGDTAEAPPLPDGVATDIELWVVDQQVSVWVRGERVYRYDYGLSWEQVLARPEAWTLPDVSIALTADEPVELYRVELDRDVYYSTSWSDPARGGINRQRDGRVPDELPEPIALREDSADHDAELYVLGDNTADSEDGRKWRDVNGWVQRRYFGGETRTRVVPRSLLVGRAFFVYYPAPQPATHGGGGVVPDFGRMRFIH